MIKQICLILFSALCIVSITGCNKNNTISENEIENILFDMHLSDGIYSVLSKPGELLSMSSNHRYQEIFEKYGVTRNQFEETMRVYAQNKETFDRIYTNVKNKLEQRKKQVTYKFMLWNNLYDKIKADITKTVDKINEYFKDTEGTEAVLEKFADWHTQTLEQMRADSIKQIEADSTLLKTDTLNNIESTDSAMQLQFNPE